MKILTKKCDKCNKVIESLYPGQLKQNYKSHRDNCKGKE